VAASRPVEVNPSVLVPDRPELPAHYLPRRRLHRSIDHALDTARVVTLVAPAASGKTTALLGWGADDPDLPMAYLALDLLDNEPVWFWSRVVGALQVIAPGLGTAATDLLLTKSDQRHFVSALRAELAALEPMVLVLDDLQDVTNPAVVHVLGDLLVHLPSSPRVILATRVEPPFRQGLLRARGMLAEIPAAELDFEDAEVDALLRGFGGDRPTGTDDALVLNGRAEGWAGGIKLAAMSLAANEDPSALIHGFSGSSRYVADLLKQEVLEAQDSRIRDFLLTTSVLDELDVGVCDAVTGGDGSAATLEQIERSGLFLRRLDVDGTRFRYQRLFREFLRHELHVLDPDRERRAHRAAAGWYRSVDEVGSAFRHLLAAGEPTEGVELLLQHGERFAASGQVAMLRSLLAVIPDDVLTNDLELLMGVSQLYVMAGMRDEAMMWLERARWRLAGRHDPHLAARLALLTGYARAQTGHLEGAISDAERALQLASQTDAPDPSLVETVHHLLASAYAGLDDFASSRRHRAAASPGEENDLPRTAYSAWLNYREGHLSRAIEHAEDVFHRTHVPWLWSIGRIVRGAVRRERNQLEEAEADLVDGLELADQWARPVNIALASIELALLRYAQGQPAEAYDMLARARTTVEGPRLRRRVDLTEASLWLRAGDLDRTLSLRRGLPAGRETALLDVRLALADGRVDDALALLTAIDDRGRALQDRISTQVLQARARMTADQAAAEDHLREAIELGRRERFVQVLAQDLAALQDPMRRLVAERDDPYVFGLLAALAESAHPAPRSAVLHEALSTREHIVLRYLPTSLSNKDIAAELHMSVNTLKTHLKSINRKLGTTSRAEAVAAARALHVF